MTRPGKPRQHARRVCNSVAAATILFALSVLGVATLAPAAADDTLPTGVAFTMTDPRITHSSGLARDARNTVFWTANAGDAGVVYAVDPVGRTQGTLVFEANLVDVEALAYSGRTLYVADIGDGTRTRESVQIYAFNNPRPNQDRGENYRVYDFVYPDGAHDAEAIVVGEDGRIQIITKGDKGVVYRAPAQLSEGSVNRLTRVGDAPAYVTDATALPSGGYAVRTYVSVEVLEPELSAPVARAALPYQRQGESMTVSLSDDALLVGTKGTPSPVLRVPIPTTLEAAPPGARTPPPSPAPTAAAGVGGSGANRTGTFVALGIALAAALIAGLVVLLSDRGDDLAARPAAKPRRLLGTVDPGDARGTKPDAPGPAGGAAPEDPDRTMIRRPSSANDRSKPRGYRREIWDLPIPDDDDPTEFRRR